MLNSHLILVVYYNINNFHIVFKFFTFIFEDNEKARIL